MEFDPRAVNGYTLEQLIDFINNGKVTFAQLQSCGLNWEMQEKLKKWLDDIKRLKQEAEAEFKAACDINTAKAFEYFIGKYESYDFLRDLVTQARMRRQLILDDDIRKREALLEDMQHSPWKYTADVMRILFEGVSSDQMEIIRNTNSVDSTIRDFVLSGMQLQYQDLLEKGIIPESVSQKDICEPDFSLPQTNVEELGDFPTDRTDVYFFGVPRSGKSSVLSGIMYKLYSKGQAAYEPHFVDGVDPCARYYRGLIQAMASKKPPVSTARDAISFVKLNIRNEKRRNEITIVELSGEAFNNISRGHESGEEREVWKELGATKCLNSSNRKCLFFIVDYSVVRGLDGAYCANMQQSLILNDALRVFCYDGPNPQKPQVGCTMSKVDTVAIIMTKCDLMNARNRNDRLDEAERYIEDSFSAFANDLAAACKKFGINRSNDYMPYILTFSLGKFYVGNTVVFNGEDSDEIIKFISSVTKSVKNERTNFFGF